MIQRSSNVLENRSAKPRQWRIVQQRWSTSCWSLQRVVSLIKSATGEERHVSVRPVAHCLMYSASPAILNQQTIGFLSMPRPGSFIVCAASRNACFNTTNKTQPSLHLSCFTADDSPVSVAMTLPSSAGYQEARTSGGPLGRSRSLGDSSKQLDRQVASLTHLSPYGYRNVAISDHRESYILHWIYRIYGSASH